jgi:hypothetical protein
MKMSLRIDRPTLDNAKFLPWLGFLALSAFLVIRYYNDRQPDLFHYSESAETLLQGENPYLQSDSRWGTVGQLIFVLPTRYLNTTQVSAMLIAISIASLYFFMSVVLKIPNKLAPYSLIACLILSPIREIFALGQINLICLGLLSLSVWLYSKMNQTKKFLNFRLLYCSLPAALAIDLKPHVMLFPTAVICLYFFSWKHIIAILCTIVQMHIIVNIKYSSFFELDWLKVIRSGSENFLTSESKNLLGIAFSFLEPPKFITLTAVFAFCLVNTVVLVLISKLEFQQALSFVSIAGFLLPYFHYYDLLIPLLVLVSNIFAEKNQKISCISLSILFLNIVPFELRQISGALFFSFGVIYFLYLQPQFRVQRKDFIVALTTYLTVQSIFIAAPISEFRLQGGLNSLIIFLLAYESGYKNNFRRIVK